MPNDLSLDRTIVEFLESLSAWQAAQTPTLRETQIGVQALQPLIELLIQPGGQSSEEVGRLAELLSATLASVDSLGKQMAKANQALTTLTEQVKKQDQQMLALSNMLKDLQEAFLES
ncbi:hypothetical protein [Paracoccus sphaerophysae]|uniref:hypothetical protein n=1 Tax=Paracoccus sphaerophysae TaxID=690417 RepID=UPI002357A543|nr:hypothetical protein [Paracoccus sphaerophysae]